MVKFVVEKKVIGEATQLLNTVANLKSFGSTPAESSGLRLTPTTLSLTNINEANGVCVDNIPITIVEGDVAPHLDFSYMINTKKLDGVVRGSTAAVSITIGDGKLLIGEDKRKYELSMFSVPPKEIPEIKLFGYAVDIKKVLKSMEDVNYITANAQNISTLSGSLFCGKTVMASDRISALYINDGALINSDDAVDRIMCTDLFAACLSRVEDAEAMPGLTEDGTRFVLKIGNTTIYKTLSAETFPKESLLKSVNGVTNNSTTTRIVSATIKLNEFMDKLRELHAIVEAEDYHISYNRNGSLVIGNSNVRSGADGRSVVDAQITMPEDCAVDTIEAKFSYTHLELIGKLFRGTEEIKLFSGQAKQNKANTIGYIAVASAEKMYFFTPKAA